MRPKVHSLSQNPHFIFSTGGIFGLKGRNIPFSRTFKGNMTKKSLNASRLLNFSLKVFLSYTSFSGGGGGGGGAKLKKNVF